VSRIARGLVRRLRTLQQRARVEVVRAAAWQRFGRGRHRYVFLDEDALRARRRSDTVFVFGSGASLNELEAADWALFERHETIGFNWFVRQDFVRVDYQVLRGLGADDYRRESWLTTLERYGAYARENRRYAEAVFVVQTGWNAINGNRAIGLELLPVDRPIFLYRSGVDQRELSWSFAEGLAHPSSTLEDAVNFAVLTGWTRIVLVGVDLYDRRYFWLPPDEARVEDTERGASVDEPHSRATSGMLATLGEWTCELAPHGIELSVYNARSLLASVMPTFPGAERSGGDA
jgi:hypothetical protein